MATKLGKFFKKAKATVQKTIRNMAGDVKSVARQVSRPETTKVGQAIRGATQKATGAA